MPTVIDHVIQGTVSNGDKIDFAKEKLAVQAFIKGREVAQAEVDASGRYKLTFTSGEERPTTELRITEAKAGESEATIELAEIVMPTEFVTTGNQASVQRNLTLPGGMVGPFNPLKHTLPILGHVFAQIGHQIVLQPGLRLDFYTFQPHGELQIIGETSEQGPPIPPLLTKTVFVWKKLLSSSSFTAPDGTYAGSFTYEIPLPSYPMPPDPYFSVEIFQFVNSNWNKVYSENITLSALQQDSHFDFLVPGDKLVLKPVITAPDVGFRFGTLGLIPCDEAHFVKGYVFSQAKDFIKGLTHRPLRGVLRIFGLFAPGSQVANYKFEIAATDENYVPGSNANLKWEDLADPLYNHKWDPLTRHWQAQSMGPSPTHLYKNIDSEPEGEWLEHPLKFEWNSANKPDGFYVLRIKALDANNSAVKVNGIPLVVEMPVLRIDNSLPVVKIEAVGAQECGKVVSTGGKLNFNITAYDPQGHVLSWYIRALAGRDALELNNDPAALQFNPPINDGAPGVGVLDSTPETVTIVKLPPNLQGCDPLAYNFELIAIGSAVTGYPGSEGWVRDDVNLMVTKS